MSNPIIRAIDCHIVSKGANGEINYLLLKRSPNQLYPNVWQCVTGKIEPSEKAFQTAIREVKEETGLHPINLWTVEHVNLFFEANQDRLNLIPVFGMEVMRKEIILSNEHSDYDWCNIDVATSKMLWAQQIEGLKAFDSMLQGPKEKLSFSKISL